MSVNSCSKIPRLLGPTLSSRLATRGNVTEPVKPSEMQKQFMVATGVYDKKPDIPPKVPPEVVNQHRHRMMMFAAGAAAVAGGGGYLYNHRPEKKSDAHPQGGEKDKHPADASKIGQNKPAATPGDKAQPESQTKKDVKEGARK